MMKTRFPYYAEEHFLMFHSVILETVFWGKPPDPQVPLKEVDTLVREKCFSTDDLPCRKISADLSHFDSHE